MPKKKNEKPLFDRQWLNVSEGSAYVMLNAEQDEHWTHASLEIKDCTRQLELSFDYGDMEGRAQRLEKLDTLVLKLQRLRAWIENHPMEETDD